MTDMDFIAWDNNNPPQLWAWAGEYGDEASEPLFRLPTAGLGDQNRMLEAANEQALQRYDGLQAEIERLRQQVDISREQLADEEDRRFKAEDERDEREKAARTLYGLCVGSDYRVKAVDKWPWLEEE